MELELNRTHLTGYETVLDTTVYQEETLETIVPDACPDILRLADTQGNVILKGKVATDGRVTLTGTARLTVLYQPDGGTGPCHLDVAVPFQISVEDSSVRAGCLIRTVPRITRADTRTMNPRKVLTRVEIAVQVKVLTAVSLAFCSGISAVDGTVEQLIEPYRISSVTAVQEKQISFEDDLSIPVGRPALEELIATRFEPICRDSKIIGNKLIIKGEVLIKVLYRASGGELSVVDFSLPISQIMEVAGVGEDATANIEICLLGTDITQGEDGRTVSVALNMLVQAIVQEERSVLLLADTYSVCCPIQMEQVPFDYHVRQTEGIEHQVVRETIEAGIQVKTVVDSYCLIGQIVHQCEGGDLRLNIQVEAVSICLSEDSECFAVSHGFDVSCSIEVPEGCTCQYSCCIGNVVANPIADGVDTSLLSPAC